ncbi:DUF4397 domain-containing protein [Mucilaginibacter pocheonensis]|uniref:DUF4397 domain-containing protein n=1 Tax=Mucilaginibacter pocheonensis TaxID=398050 RepID=A0ABU1TG98_9SPHI|nr:DUF4397 domain-containing protein [Mucilaginibacter pocheonensis]MDR6944225.1 hypothetical protein [Mucilaginibacter pocheonensis]
MKKHYKYLNSPAIAACLALALISGACKKAKLDPNVDNRAVTDARKNSTLRVVNLGGYNQVQVNGDTLTNYVVREKDSPLSDSYPATKYFPDNGRLGTTWSIPQEFLTNGAAKFLAETSGFQEVPTKIEFNVQEDAQQPVDYYLLPTKAYMQVTGLPVYVKVPRSIAPAADASHFKIRLLNLTGTITDDPRMENLVGPLTLAWADGTPVSTQTSNVASGKYSDYIDLPYTTAQLKVLTPNGTQVPGYESLLVLNPASSTIDGTPGLSYAPIKTYAPGGVYTMVVTPRQYNVPSPGTTTGETVKAHQNSIRLISDITEPVNVTYFRMQAVNTLPGINGVKILVNGKPLGTAIDYTAHSDYDTFIIGQYDVQAVNASGTVLASTKVKAEANSNYTLWLNPGVDGKPVIAAVANDLSGTLVKDATDDATYARYFNEFSFSIRFLNFCADMPYLTLTTDNAQDFNSMYGFNSAAVTNLRPCVIPVEFPYIRAAYDAKPYQIMAFRSTPAVTPGTWASDIPVLSGKDLIARPALYVKGVLPNHEAGFYSIALVGKAGAQTSAAYKAKMIIVKHSK